MRVYITLELTAGQRAALSRELGVAVVGRTDAAAWLHGRLQEALQAIAGEGSTRLAPWAEAPVPERERRLLAALRGARMPMPLDVMKTLLGLRHGHVGDGRKLDAALTRLRRAGQARFVRGRGWEATPGGA